MSLGKEMTIRAASCSLLLGLFMSASTLVMAQNEPAPPPPPGPGMGGMMLSMHGPGGGAFFHEEIGDGQKVVTGAPMTAVIEVTHDSTLQDGNTIHTQNQSTVYRDSEGRVRREVPFEFMTPTTGSTKGTMIIITDPVAGARYVLNPQNKTAHSMPLHPPKPPAGAAEGESPVRAPNADVSTTDLGAKSILGLPSTGTRVTRTIPAGQIGNAKAIEVVTERWMSTDLQIPMSTTHSDPMMGTMSSQVTSVTRGEPAASLFQVPSDYKVVNGKPGDMMYMTKP
jgi:hypothetical protein